MMPTQKIEGMAAPAAHGYSGTNLPNAGAAGRGALLRGALRANALFSGATGVTLLLGAWPLARWLGVGSGWLLAGVGVGLLLFAAQLWRGAGKAALDVREARLVIGLDLAWVAGSALLLLLAFSGAASLTRAGLWAVALMADAVALLALLQWLGVRRLEVRRLGG